MRNTVEATLRVAAVILAMVSCSVLSSCQSKPSVPSRTTWELDLDILDSENRRMRFKVGRDGVLSFAGGTDAVVEHYTWSAPLSDEQLLQLHGILLHSEWLRERPSKSGSGIPERTVRISHDGQQHRTTVHGADQTIDELQRVLHTAALVRHQRVLDQLPQAGAQK